MKKIVILLLCFCFMHIKGEANSDKKLHVAALAFSKKDPGLDSLLYSAKHYGIKITLVGLGTRNPTSAATTVVEFLDKLDNDSVALLLANTHSLILANKKKILRKFHKIGMPVVIAATEKKPNIKPFPFCFYPRSPTKFKYLAPDAIIGKVKALKAIFYRMLAKDCFRTQNSFNFDFITNQNQYTLDYYNNIFFTLYNVRKSDIRVTNIDNKVHVFSTCTNPTIIINNQHNLILFNRICKVLF